MDPTPLLDRSFVEAVGLNSLASLAVIILLLILGWWFVWRRRAVIRSHVGAAAMLIFLFLFLPVSDLVLLATLSSIVMLSGIILLLAKVWRRARLGEQRGNDRLRELRIFVTIVIFVVVLVLSLGAVRATANLIIAAISPSQSITVVLHQQLQDPKTQRVLLMFDNEGDFGDVWLPSDYAATFKKDACYTVVYKPSPLLEVEGRSKVYATGIQESANCQ